MSNITYWRRLANHPGLPIAIVMTGIGTLTGSLIGALVMAVVCWAPVLLTARTQPVPRDGK